MRWLYRFRPKGGRMLEPAVHANFDRKLFIGGSPTSFFVKIGLIDDGEEFGSWAVFPTEEGLETHGV